MRQLADGEIIEVLQANGIGVLALNDRSEASPYAIPVAFGYDEKQDRLVLQLEGDEESHKQRCLQHDANVGLTVYEETDSKTLWRSVLVRGELTEIDYGKAEPALAVLAQNTQFAPNPVMWGDSSTVTPYELDIETWSGRAFPIE